MFVVAYRATERGIRQRVQPEAPALPAPERIVRFKEGIEPIDIPTPKHKDILREVAAKHGLPVSVMKGKRRWKTHVACRYEAIGRVWQECRDREGNRLSMPRIGMIFDRAHTSILHALRKLGLAG